MADQSHITEEVENYLRMSLLNRISPRAVRVFFDKELRPSCLEASIAKNREKLSDLGNRHVINAASMTLLFPSDGM